MSFYTGARSRLSATTRMLAAEASRERAKEEIEELLAEAEREPL